VAPGGTITFAPGLEGTLWVTRGELVIDKDLNLVGPGANRLSIQTTNSRVFRVTSGRVQMSGVAITAGYARGSDGASAFTAGENGGDGGAGEGGGILNFGDLTLTDVTVAHCSARGGYGGSGGPNFAILSPGSGGNGGAGRGGGICNRGVLTLLRCGFMHHWCAGGFAGPGGDDSDIRATPGGLGGSGGLAAGGALYNAGTLFATNCTFATNILLGGWGGRGGQGIPRGGDGGAGGAATGAGFCDEGSAIIVSCTFGGNDARPGQPGVGGTGSSSAGATGPSGLAAGGGLFSDTAPPHVRVRNSLSAGNRASIGADAIGGLVSDGFNFIGTFNDGGVVSLNPFIEPTDRVGLAPQVLDARLGPVGYHGGPTLVQSLFGDSPAIDQGHASAAATDQRGVPRARDLAAIPNVTGGDGSDIGAFEAEPPPILSIRLGAPVGGTNTVILSWPNPSTGYVLQQTASMSAPGGGWVDVTQPPVINGAFREVALPATGQFCLFRLGEL
jgi:hypothetical protein